jgi:Tfp pilus assembly protein PilF
MPLEIVNDDAAPARTATPPPTLELEAAAAPAGAGTSSPRRGAPTSDSAGRATAKKVFEAKFREPNPRLPFYIALGVLGLFAVATVLYFWYQLRPPPALVNLNPQRSAGESAVVATPASAPITVAAAPAKHEPPIPGLPEIGTRAETPKVAPPRAAKKETQESTRARSKAAPRRREAPTPKPKIALPTVPAAAIAPATAPARVVVAVNPSVQVGYDAYMAGDLAKARSAYAQALRDEPANRDALLGLAALDVRVGRLEAAEALYLRILEDNPRDAEAQAALLSLRAGRSDPLATESRIKSLLAAEPAAHALNFALGNQLAEQSRWAEAQQEYLKAYTAEPDNADFAYNVAVSFDHLHDRRQALEYYQRAVALARERGASFDPAAARARIAQLAR